MKLKRRKGELISQKKNKLTELQTSASQDIFSFDAGGFEALDISIGASLFEDLEDEENLASAQLSSSDEVQSNSTLSKPSGKQTAPIPIPSRTSTIGLLSLLSGGTWPQKPSSLNRGYIYGTSYSSVLGFAAQGLYFRELSETLQERKTQENERTGNNTNG